MNWVKIAISIFILLETSNVLILYFFPDSKLANGMGAFKAWKKSKQDRETHHLTSYLVNWVAGTKLIFIGLLVVLLFTADQKTLTITAGVMVLAISSFYWRLFPLIRSMDREGQIDPPGYSKTLGWMILVFIATFIAAIFLMRIQA